MFFLGHPFVGINRKFSGESDWACDSKLDIKSSVYSCIALSTASVGTFLKQQLGYTFKCGVQASAANTMTVVIF